MRNHITSLWAFYSTVRFLAKTEMPTNGIIAAFYFLVHCASDAHKIFGMSIIGDAKTLHSKLGKKITTLKMNVVKWVRLFGVKC